MEDRFFDPEYPASHYVMLLIATLPGLLGIVASVALGLGREITIVSLVIAVLLPLLLRTGHIRRVVFGSDLVVVRSLLHDRYFNYQELQRVESDRVLTPRKPIHFGNWVNRRSFLDMLWALRDQGWLAKTEFDPAVLREIDA